LNRRLLLKEGRCIKMTNYNVKISEDGEGVAVYNKIKNTLQTNSLNCWEMLGLLDTLKGELLDYMKTLEDEEDEY